MVAKSIHETVETFYENIIEPVRTKRWLSPKPAFLRGIRKYRFSSMLEWLVEVELHDTLK